ncbi:MAG: SDR family oxidoreductase [Clostridia bacterium]|nr:SDR family oxidoreductase [Clostridia bacterium]
MLRGKYALITGGSRGIGFAIAKELYENGCSVVITGRKEETLRLAAEKIGKNVKYLVWDMADLSICEKKINEAAEMMGGLDIIVNNAGLFAKRSEWSTDELLETTIEEWRSVMEVNLDALFFSMKCGVNYMLEHGIKGNILNVTSVAGYEPGYGAYGASKTAANNLTRGWGKKFAPMGIVINGIAPGPIATEMNNWHEGDSMENERIPYGRYGTIEEIAKLAKYLLSEDACMICGEVVTIDGAYSIR